MKKILILLFCLCLVACHEKAQTDVTSSNGDFKVELLFEVDGCKVYRFYDWGYKYFSSCNGLVQWEQKEGKHNVLKQIPTH